MATNKSERSQWRWQERVHSVFVDQIVKLILPDKVHLLVNLSSSP